MDLQSYEELKEITVFSHWVEWESAGIDLAERALAWFVNQIWKYIQTTLGYMRAVYSSTVYMISQFAPLFFYF